MRSASSAKAVKAELKGEYKKWLDEGRSLDHQR